MPISCYLLCGMRITICLIIVLYISIMTHMCSGALASLRDGWKWKGTNNVPPHSDTSLFMATLYLVHNLNNLIFLRTSRYSTIKFVKFGWYKLGCELELHINKTPWSCLLFMKVECILTGTRYFERKHSVRKENINYILYFATHWELEGLLVCYMILLLKWFIALFKCLFKLWVG